MEEIKKEKDISYSKISLFKKCALNYYAKYINKQFETDKETLWPGGIIGSACHNGLEKVIAMMVAGESKKNIEGSMKGIFPSLYQQIRDGIDKTKTVYKESREFKDNPDGFMSEGDRALMNITRFFTSYFNEFKEIESEKKYEAQATEMVKCVGVVDSRLVLNDEFYIADLKITGDSSLYWHVMWENDIQSLMYDFLLEKNIGSTPTKFMYLVWDRTLKILFLKERPVGKMNRKVLDKYINELSKFNLESNEEMAIKMANPSRENCLWCPLKASCPKVWQPEIVNRVRKLIK